MNNQICLILFIYLCFCSCNAIYGRDLHSSSNPSFYSKNPNHGAEQSSNDNTTQNLNKLNADFLASIAAGDTAKSRLISNSILKIIKEGNNDNLTFSDSQYYLGVYYLLKGKNSKAINWFRLSLSYRDHMSTKDDIHAKCLFNLGIAYNSLGDYKRMEQSILRSLEIEKELYGESSPMLIRSLAALVTTYLNLNDYDKAISYGNNALKLFGGSVENYDSDAAILFTNIGICYVRLSDYTKAALYLEQAESIYEDKLNTEDDNYINLINSLAATYYFLGQIDKSDEYFNKGISKLKSSNSTLSLNFLNSFAIMLGNAGKLTRGEALLKSSLAQAESYFGYESRDYFEVLKNYAEYLRNFKIDVKRSISLYEKCIDYLNDHKEDLSLKDHVYYGYALALSENGESSRSLEIIQKMLFSGISGKTPYSTLENPDINSIEAVQWSINLLKAKYRILWDIYTKQKNYDYLLAASETAEIIIALLDRVRINISEEESRLILGDKFRDSYINAIRDFNVCYKNSGSEAFLAKAFEYSEKSKVAGLLASTRELKASQFHIPFDIAELERKLKTEISFYNARISDESNKEIPDTAMMLEWKGLVMKAVRQRDSLITIFEELYPGYYLFKYNNNAVNPRDIPGVAGRNINYINYVVSDTILYIFLTNRKNMQLLSVPVDSGFFNKIREFRRLLSFPISNAKADYTRYAVIGNELYKIIIEPIRKYFISNRLLISPDNILSYIPFEVLPAKMGTDYNNLYHDIPYLMKDFSISYTYSATFLAESRRSGRSIANSLVAFAPVYTGSINVDSLFKDRQAEKQILHDLPFARMEAESVSDLTGGKLFINDRAKESVYKSEAGKYDIVHLAMHTVLNDQHPMYSKMLFYQEKDSIEDGNLNTYEVYGIPLKAKMVMLSSCNTGIGVLHSGEGILSLARGFVYSGSQSVVMSMWEIEDRSGTEIVKSFYKYLKRGVSKSNALRKARLSFLKNADMLRSHPYFWSSLVIYGNDKPLYFAGKLAFMISIAALLLCIMLILNYHKSR